MLDKMNKVRGFFSYKLLDLAGNIVDEYSEENHIMDTVPRMYFEIVSGLDTTSPKATPPVDIPTTLVAKDFELCAIALGDKGIKDGKPKIIKGDEPALDSMKKNQGILSGETIQATWKKLEEKEDALGVTIQTEGEMSETKGFAAFNNKGMNTASSLHSETGIDVISEVKDGKITLRIEMLEKTGNGIDWSEAALFVRHKQDPGFDTSNAVDQLDPNTHPIWTKDPNYAGVPSLGTIFSKKTFPVVHKTNACVLQMEWVLDFNLSVQDLA